MQHAPEVCCNPADSPPALKMAKITDALHEVDPTTLKRADKKKLSFQEFNELTCKRFDKGFKIRKEQGHLSIVGHDAKVMDLVARPKGVFWDDGDRVEGECFGKTTNVDCFMAYADSSTGSSGVTYESIISNRALSISDTNGTFKSKILSMEAQKILVNINIGKDVKPEDRSVALYTAAYFEAFAAFYEHAGGIFTSPSCLTLKYKDGENEEERAATRTTFYNYIEMMDALLLGPGETWKHPDAQGWAYHHWNDGLKKTTMIAVNTRFHVAPEKASVAPVSNSFGTSLIKTVFTSSDHYSMSYGNACYSNTVDQLKKCSGIYSKNEQSNKIEMAGIELGESNLDFTLKSVESMHVAPEVVVVKEEKEPEEKTVNDDATETAKEELPPPSASLYPFVDNKELKGVFVAVLSHGYRARPVVRKNTYRGGGGSDSDENTGCQTKGLTRGITRGGGGRKRIASPPREPSPEPVEACSDIKYPVIGVGVKLFDVEGMPAYDSNKLQMLKPSFTIMNVLVWRESDDDASLTEEEQDDKSLQLVDAVAQQIKDFDSMAKRCVYASISAIHESANHLVKKADMTDDELVALTATKKINASVSTFFAL